MKLAKKLLAFGVAGMMSLALLASCGGKDSGTTAATTAAPADTTAAASAAKAAAPATGGDLSGELSVSGSTSVQPLFEALAEEFIKINPGVKIDVQGGGSTTGYENVTKGVTEIGNLSRNLKDEEKDDTLNVHTLATDGIGVVVNKENKVKSISTEDLVKVFTGEITDWADLGGDAGEIVVIQREAGSGTRGAFEELLDIEDKVKASQDANETGIVKNTVQGNANAIGYISLGSADENVHCLAVDDVEPSEATVGDGSYTLARPFLSITSGEESELAKAFFEFAASDDAIKVIEEMGYFAAK